MAPWICFKITQGTKKKQTNIKQQNNPGEGDRNIAETMVSSTESR